MILRLVYSRPAPDFQLYELDGDDGPLMMRVLTPQGVDWMQVNLPDALVMPDEGVVMPRACLDLFREAVAKDGLVVAD